MTSFSQQPLSHCGTEAFRQQALLTHPEYKVVVDNIEAFTEHYISTLANEKKTRAPYVYSIPVVVHVIHNGESVGSGANISAAQIYSQIAVLNKDYRLKNTDSLKPTHPYWVNTDDCEIEFCLAWKDPAGNYTTGITRYNGGQSSYDYPELENIHKPNTIWDHERYLNIWVCTLGGTASSLLGYATPPGTAIDNDGVVIGHTYFGTTGTLDPAYNKGRTATHEIGHFFNLRHTWGDAVCGSDFVSDTEPAEDANYGCPTFPFHANSACGAGPNGEMYMNYMDYVDDACMKMFTNGQKNRMRATLAVGGSRSTLTTSNVCIYPTGLPEIADNSVMSVYPNPTSDHFYLKNTTNFVADFSIQLFNSIGQEFTSEIVMNKEAGNLYYVNTSALPNGTYFLKIHSNTKSITKSIAIIK